jgi:CubicO group peptidase (beta-lactamase class C family)
MSSNSTEKNIYKDKTHESKILARPFTIDNHHLVSCRDGRYDPSCCSASPQAGSGPTDPQEVKGFIDPLMNGLMADYHIPGGAIVIVKDGQLLFAKGYGYADVERQIPATSDGSLFRVGSISKVFTWTAVMQLAEQGKLDLNANVNSYLSHFQIPATFPEPITLAHLMTYTAGFEEQMGNGAVYTTQGNYLPLEDFLADKMPARIFPPGQVVAYSNYGTALAGGIVAEVSGEPFEEYVQNHILGPLAMEHSSFLQPLPAELAQDAAVGYGVDDAGIPHAQTFEYLNVRPAGALSATASDMAHFMIAHLQDGLYGENHILQAASAQDMRRQHYVFDESLPGMTRGFAEDYHNGIHFVLHSGTTNLSSSLLALLPDQNLGVFVTFNSWAPTPKRINLLHELLDHYYPAPTPQQSNHQPISASMPPTLQAFI